MENAVKNVIPSMQELLHAESRLEVQLALMILQAVFWHYALPFISKNIIQPFIESQTWKDQYLDQLFRAYRQGLGVKTDDTNLKDIVIYTNSVLVQHLVGGALCIPAIFPSWFPWISSRMATTLVLHGTLTELGWELDDSVTKIYTHFFGSEKSKAGQPKQLCFFAAMHHVMGITMILPMNLYFPNLAYYHLGAFSLQFAAFWSTFLQHYSLTLDVKTVSGWRQMMVSTILAFFVILFSRGVGYVIVAHGCMSAIFAANYFWMFAGAALALSTMSLINLMIFKAVIVKLIKFYNAKPDSESRSNLKKID